MQSEPPIEANLPLKQNLFWVKANTTHSIQLQVISPFMILEDGRGKEKRKKDSSIFT
jgi:hypothetical protein